MKKFINGLLRLIMNRREDPVSNRVQVAKSLSVVAIVLFFIFLINFAMIVGTDSKYGVKLSEKARQVHQVDRVVQAKRGSIYDRNGIPIAEDSTTYNVYAIIDKDYKSATGEVLYVEESQYDKVASIFNEKLDMDVDYVRSQLRQDHLKQVSFGPNGSGISYGTMSEIRDAMKAAGIEGIDFTTSPNRSYPNGVFASQFIGLAQLKENEDGSKSLVGNTGMEASLNSILAGTDGKVSYEKDKTGNLIPGTDQVTVKKVDGSDVYTTLSQSLQLSLEARMDMYQSRFNGKYVSATLVAAKTGEILATTQRPTFNPDTKDGIKDLDKQKAWTNILYQGQFEPGSTMKVFSLAAAIDNKTFPANEYYDNSELVIADATIKDWEVNMGRSTGQTLTYAQGFAFSSNVGMARLEQKMGGDKWLDYLSRFKFGLPTRFGMGNEDFGSLPGNNVVTQAMSAFGQGISVTQIQMLRGMTSIANDGVMIEPKFIAAIHDNQQNTARKSKKEILSKPISKETAKKTRDYMITVGTDPFYGTLFNKTDGVPIIQVDGQDVAVKSGTAQIAAPAEEGGGYLTGANDYIYSAIAMTPSENPDFIMYVTVQEPENKFDPYTWGDIFNPILEEAEAMKETLNLVEPTTVLDNVEDETPYAMPSFKDKTPGNYADELRRNLVQPIVVGTGNSVKKTSIAVGENAAANEQVLLLTNEVKSLPDFYGWTKSSINQFAEWQGIEITIKGKGHRVVKQNVKSDTALNKVKDLTVTLGE